MSTDKPRGLLLTEHLHPPLQPLMRRNVAVRLLITRPLITPHPASDQEGIPNMANHARDQPSLFFPNIYGVLEISN